MKALIFSMTCGEGHNMMARSLAQAFDKAGVENKIVQTFGYNEKRVARENKMFLWACKHIPHVYDFVWNKLRKKNHATDKLPYYVKDCLKYFKQQINSYKPDIIMCTHFYASSVLTYMKKQNLIDKKIITGTILVDFCLAPYWEHSNGIDYVFQPYTNTTESLLQKGFNQKQIITTGLPIREEFYANYQQGELRKKLNLPEKFTVLNIGGGNGLGNTLKLVKSILSKNLDITLVVINGKNIKNYNKIKKFITKNNIKNVINLGFVNNVHEYMMSSDVLVSRCGSSCLTEGISVGKPFIIREKMILNEKINKEFFIKNGCALGMKKITDAGDKVEYLKNNPKIYEKMKKNIEKMRKPYSAQKIVEFLINKIEQ